MNLTLKICHRPRPIQCDETHIVTGVGWRLVESISIGIMTTVSKGQNEANCVSVVASASHGMLQPGCGQIVGQNNLIEVPQIDDWNALRCRS